MEKEIVKKSHPTGELEKTKFKPNQIMKNMQLSADTFAGKVHIEWAPQAAVTPLGQLAFFIEFLKQGNLFDPWVDGCPLNMVSNNAPTKRDILGTILLSVLSGHCRYAHITALRGDSVNPDLLGMKRVMSEDSIRRAMIKIEEEAGVRWAQEHLDLCTAPLLIEPWILDVDSSVKLLYGHQEGAVKGYNPKKPGRPSHSYHIYMIANLRLVLDVEVQAGNLMSANHTAPDLWKLLDRLGPAAYPKFIRGDSAFGTDAVMMEAEARGLDYLFKMKLTKKVKELIVRSSNQTNWTPAGPGFEALESTIKLQGWTKERRAIVIRKKLQKELIAADAKENKKQLELPFTEVITTKEPYEYAVLVTSLKDELLAIAQHYRDRADSENAFDELKNQWGWSGFTTKDMKRSRLMARIIALIYNWWSLFVRLAEPDFRLEAISSRPLLLHAVGRQTSHAGQTCITITSLHGKRSRVESLLSRITEFFRDLKSYAEQLSPIEKWYRILSQAMEKYLRGRSLRPPAHLPAPA